MNRTIARSSLVLLASRVLAFAVAHPSAPFAAATPGASPLVFDPAAQSQAPRASEAPSPASEPPSRALLRELTTSPRLAGTCGSMWSAELVARWLRDAGWQVEIDDREVLLSLPRSISLSVFDNAFSDQPILEHLDRFDPDAIPPGDLPKCNGWSASGDVRGLVVDAGYGLRADFERLKTLGVDVRGAIALVRYGRSYRGIKVDLATQFGCSGVLLFDDPAEDGPERGPTWPAGPWKPDWDAQRGSISPMAHIPGDPSTPGWASGKPGDASVKRASKKELDEALPRIPCIPIGSRDARAMIARLAAVETKDAEGKPKSERLGPGPAQAHLVVDQPRDMRTIHNVIARLPGESERCVIAGAHRDSWVRGANDDGAGTVLMVRAAQHLGQKVRAGWKLKNTIVLCLWDAEEFGMIGSTEWGEANAAWIEKNAIAYVNADTGVGGRHFRGASGTPGMLGTLKNVLQRIPAAAPVAEESNTGTSSAPASLAEPTPGAASTAPAPASGAASTAPSPASGAASTAPAPDSVAKKTLWDEWCDGVRARSKDKSAEPHLSLPGSGSDFAVFLHHLSVPILQFGFGDSESGQYHTTFDDFNVVERYIDPGFIGHELAGRFAAELLFELAQRGADSFQPREAAEELARRAREAADEIAPDPLVAGSSDAAAGSDGGDASSARIDPALEHLARSLRAVSDKLALTATSMSAAPSTAPPAEKIDPAKPSSSSKPAESSTSPARAISFYALLEAPGGLPGRPWYRNRLWTPGLEDGYGSETFPTLRLAAKESASALDRETASLIEAIGRLSSETARR
jgi:N-acetylated-alpha-linked acidic dipeptidase